MQHQNKTNQDLTNVLRWWRSFTEGQRQDWTRNPRGSHSCARAPVFKAQNTHNLRKNAHKISGPAVVCAVHRVMMTEWRVFANYFPTTLIINIFVPRTENDRLHGWPSHNCKHCQLQSSYSSKMFYTWWLPPLNCIPRFDILLCPHINDYFIHIKALCVIFPLDV